MKNISRLSAFLFFILALNTIQAQDEKPKDYQTPESIVQAIFDFCTVVPGKTKEWDYISNIVLDKGIFIVRAGSVGYIPIDGKELAKILKSDVEKYGLDKSGYDDRILKVKTVEFGSIATCFVHFESRVPGSSRPPKIGLNMFSMVKKDGRWWLVSVVEEVVNKDRPIPESIFK